jgi:DNA-binding beta-propeller fold protein YncE
MKKIYLSISCIMLSAIGLAQVSLDHVSTHFTDLYDESAAEIVTYDAGSQKLFFSNAFDNSVGNLDFSDPTNLSLLSTIDIDPYGDGVNSVSAFDGMLAIAVEIDDEPGIVVFFDHEGNFQSQVEVGYLPDMLTFSHDGNKVVVACEGEPSSDYLMDPVGSVAIIDVSGGIASVTQGDVTITEIGSYGGSLSGVRIFGPEMILPLKRHFKIQQWS